jgi:hypothetical protein
MGLARWGIKGATKVHFCACVGYLDMCRPVLVFYVDKLRSSQVKKESAWKTDMQSRKTILENKIPKIPKHLRVNSSIH